uniref:3'-5' exonuclease domain-containing protein n=1 Tax=Glossina austeni TaxID=7395 RepID=A0A1A9US51_GLOAU
MHTIPKSLKNLLEDKEIIIVGIAPAADAQKLQEDYGIYVASTFDIRYLAVMIGCKPLGLEKLSRNELFFTNVDFVRIKYEIKDLVGHPFIKNFAQCKSVNLARGSLLSGYDTCRLQAPNVIIQFYSRDHVKLLCVKCDRLSDIFDVQIHNALSLMCNAPSGYEQVTKQYHISLGVIDCLLNVVILGHTHLSRSSRICFDKKAKISI